MMLTLAMVVAASPFVAVVEARQAMGQVASFEIARSLFHLAIAIGVSYVLQDRIVVYTLLLAASTGLRSSAFAVVCMMRFPESRPNPRHVRLREIRRIAGFAGWASVLQLGDNIVMHASIVLVGVFFSPLIAAGYAIAMRAGEYHDNFSWVFPRVVQPAMTRLEARGRREDVHRLVLLTGKYSMLGVLFFVVPVMLDTEGILALWLGDVPPNAALLVRLELLWLTIDVSSRGFDTAAIAHGGVARYAMMSTGMWLVSLPLCVLWFGWFDAGVWALPATMVCISLVMARLRVGYGGALIGVDFSQWISGTIRPVVAVLLPSLAAAWGVHWAVGDGPVRYAAVAMTYAAVSAPLIWWVALESDLRDELRSMLRSAPAWWSDRLKTAD
jgi:O-antigen/teichoic acid export membrane protein